MKRQSSKAKVKAYGCGFTIVELLLVVVIITLIASVGGGIYVGTYKKELVKKAARNFLLAAKYARIMALQRQRPCRMELDTANNRFWLVTDELDEESGQVEQLIVRDLYFKPVEFGGDVKFEKIQITSADLAAVFETDEQRTIVFLPNGTAPSAVIQIGDGRNHYTTGISAATGKAKTYFGTAEEVKIGTIDLDEEW